MKENNENKDYEKEIKEEMTKFFYFKNKKLLDLLNLLIILLLLLMDIILNVSMKLN